MKKNILTNSIADHQDARYVGCQLLRAGMHLHDEDGNLMLCHNHRLQ